MKMDVTNAGVSKLLDQLVAADNAQSLIEICGFNAWFGRSQVLENINLVFNKHQINCIVGPSGSGKSTLIRSIDRINDDVATFRQEGKIIFDGKDIYTLKDVTRLRTLIGLVFQKPCVFPRSIGENVLFGLQFLTKLSKQQKQITVEKNLKAVALWDEVNHRLEEQADCLSIGQQQRLCIARTLAVNPQVLLLDEPTSSLDPTSCRVVEDLMLQLKDQYTIIFVTHNILQAKRIADRLVFMCEGKIIEQGDKTQLFEKPKKQQTWNYLNNEYCKC